MSKILSPAIAMATEYIRAKIRAGTYVAGGYLPTETALAGELLVSRGTIREAIEALSASGEITKRLHSRPIVGLQKEVKSFQSARDLHVWVSHPIEDDASLTFVKGVSKSLKGTPYRMIVREPTRFFGGFVADDERSFFENLLRDDQVAGAIVQCDPWARNADIIQKVLAIGKPIVFVDSPAPKGVQADHVGTANLAAARRCVEHMVHDGHQKIVCIVDSEIASPVIDRVKGYKRAMIQAGLAEEIQVLVADQIDNSILFPVKVAGDFARILRKNGKLPELCHRLACTILSMPERPTGIFASCDVIAYWVAAMLEGAGLRVPQDVSVVGFDWLSRWGDADHDILTSASQDFEGFGRHAVDLFLDRLESEPNAPARQILLEAPVVVRSTTSSNFAHWTSSNIEQAPETPPFVTN